MTWKFNPFTAQLDYYEASEFKGVLAAPPGSPVEGWTYINSVDSGYYIYYGGAWQLLTTFPSSGSISAADAIAYAVAL
jgi:hypothetical protein